MLLQRICRKPRPPHLRRCLGTARTLIVASAAGVDTALMQNDTGGFGFGGIDLDI
jgi:hypothetical protein